MKASKKPAQSRPSRAFSCAIQITGTPRLRSAAARRLMVATMPRAAGTSIGAPGATKAFCMSMTTSALFFASSESKRCSRPRRAMTRSTISRRISLDMSRVYLVTLGMNHSNARYDRRSLLTFLAGTVALGPVAAAAQDCAPGRAEAIGAALLDRYVAAVNAHDTSSFAEIHTESYIQHSGRSANGLIAQVENFRGMFARMPDLQMRVEDRIIAGDKVVARNTFSATHTRPLQGIPPTGRRFTLRTIDIWRVENGKFAEHWDLIDAAGLQKQLRGE